MVQLASGDVYSNFLQLFQQQGLRNAAIVVLIQDVPNKLYSRVLAGQLGGWVGDHLTIFGCLPTFQRILDAGELIRTS
jgi:hypothetical protein